MIWDASCLFVVFILLTHRMELGSLFSQYVAFFSLDVHVRRLSPGIWVAVF